MLKVSNPPKPRKSTKPTLKEIREAHQHESDRISEAIRNGTVDQLQRGPSIFSSEMTPEELRERQRKRLEAMVALKGAFNIFEIWRLNPEEMRELLGKPDEKTFMDWRNRSVWSLPEDTLMRISYVLGIYKALRILYPTEQQAAEWPRKPNRAFQGRSALDVMLAGDLAGVRRYLDGQHIDDSDLLN